METRGASHDERDETGSNLVLIRRISGIAELEAPLLGNRLQPVEACAGGGHDDRPDAVLMQCQAGQEQDVCAIKRVPDSAVDSFGHQNPAVDGLRERGQLTAQVTQSEDGLHGAKRNQSATHPLEPRPAEAQRADIPDHSRQQHGGHDGLHADPP